MSPRRRVILTVAGQAIGIPVLAGPPATAGSPGVSTIFPGISESEAVGLTEFAIMTCHGDVVP